eukprot:6205083-Pleurochrysis_carterae.AAC.2
MPVVTSETNNTMAGLIAIELNFMSEEYLDARWFSTEFSEHSAVTYLQKVQSAGGLSPNIAEHLVCLEDRAPS